MRTLALISSILALMLGSTVAAAQDRAAAAAAPGMAASAPMDCANAKVKAHDHGAERGMPTSAAKPCSPAAASAASAPAKTKAKLVHDHAKVHKNQ